MSGWELFTWFNAGVLAVGSVVVFVLFLRQLPTFLPPREPQRSEDESAESPPRL